MLESSTGKGPEICPRRLLSTLPPSKMTATHLLLRQGPQLTVTVGTLRQLQGKLQYRTITMEPRCCANHRDPFEVTLPVYPEHLNRIG